VDVHAAEARQVEDSLPEDLPECRDDEEVRARFGEPPDGFLAFQALGLEEREGAIRRAPRDGRRNRGSRASGGPVGLRDDQRDLVSRVEKSRERRHGEGGRSEEEDPHPPESIGRRGPPFHDFLRKAREFVYRISQPTGKRIERKDESMAGLTKSQIAEHLAEKTGTTKKVAAQFLEELAALAYKQAKNSFTLPGLGKLVLVNRKARMGRNPATGEAIKIPASPKPPRTRSSAPKSSGRDSGNPKPGSPKSVSWDSPGARRRAGRGSFTRFKGFP
jgi:DNA-binding protein HU-beta